MIQTWKRNPVKQSFIFPHMINLNVQLRPSWFDVLSVEIFCRYKLISLQAHNKPTLLQDSTSTSNFFGKKEIPISLIFSVPCICYNSYQAKYNKLNTYGMCHVLEKLQASSAKSEEATNNHHKEKHLQRYQATLLFFIIDRDFQLDCIKC